MDDQGALLLCNKHSRGIKLQPFTQADAEAGFGKKGCPFCDGGELHGAFNRFSSRKAVADVMNKLARGEKVELPPKRMSNAELERIGAAELLKSWLQDFIWSFTTRYKVDKEGNSRWTFALFFIEYRFDERTKLTHTEIINITPWCARVMGARFNKSDNTLTYDFPPREFVQYLSAELYGNIGRLYLHTLNY